ncbi:MAG: outer membrane beta-barrel protein [Myxococcota bacterium]|nr:outer membrane beta-barrel protein [Myxococcota bacterium]
MLVNKIRIGYLLTSIVMLSLSFSATTLAQSAGDNGFRIGKLRLHPSFNVISGYSTNPNRLQEASRGDASISVSPGLDLNLKSPKIDLSGSLNYDYRHYLGINDTDTVKLSELSRHAANLSLHAALMKKTRLPIGISLSYVRGDEPQNNTQGTKLAYNRISGNIDLKYKPGAGALIWSVNLAPSVNRFDADTADSFETMTLNTTSSLLWKFFPRTAMFLDANYNATRYLNDSDQQDVGVAHGNIGLSGQLTSKMSTLFKVGYGDNLLSGDAHQSSVVGRVEFKYRLTPRTRITLGADRGILPATVYEYYVRSGGFLGAEMKFAKRFVAASKIDVGLIEYGPNSTRPDKVDEAADSTLRRTDLDISAETALSAKIRNFLVLALSHKLYYRDAQGYTTQTAATDGNPAATINYGYVVNEIFFRIAARY